MRPPQARQGGGQGGQGAASDGEYGTGFPEALYKATHS